MRSPWSISRDTAFIIVVLPEPVPPEMMMFNRARPAISRMRATWRVRAPNSISLAKSIATLDHLSGGRVSLGVGFGWNREEAADHGVPFADRRAIAREHVLCMRALWRDDPAEFHGEFVDLDPCYSWPKPVRGRVPVLLGGAATPGPRTMHGMR